MKAKENLLLLSEEGILNSGLCLAADSAEQRDLHFC